MRANPLWRDNPASSIPYAEASRDSVLGQRERERDSVLGQRERSGVPTGGDALESAASYDYAKVGGSAVESAHEQEEGTEKT